MSLKARVMAGFAVLLAVGLAIVADGVRRELRPRYLEAVEESLNDTAHTLAALLETQVRDGRLEVALLRDVLDRALDRRFEATIYDVTKTGVGLNVYVTDWKGTVLYDSRGPENVGRDFSRWNDVLLTLRGDYGARATRTVRDDPGTSVLHVAAPIRSGREIVGVVTVIKANDGVTPFVDAARSRFLTAAVYAAAAFALLGVVLSFWITRPLTRLSEHVRSLRIDPDARAPELGVPELTELGREFNAVWQELRGKRFVERYVQSLTHEIRSPLTSIRGSAELLEEHLPDEQRALFHRTILRESRRIDGIVQRMLDLASLEARRELHDVEDVAVADLVDEALGALAPRLERGRLTVVNDVPGDLVVRGERFLLHHALANLLDNAVRFSPEGGAIGVHASRADGEVRLSVSDQGPGVPDFARERVFERFYSLPDPASGAKGVGLGLSFVREAAGLHGGRAELVNRPGGGAEATVILPEAPSPLRSR